MSRFKEELRKIVSLSDYINIEEATQSIRNSIEFKGPNVWILALAVIIASVGLNVNSIPVIIGAMLISPLMGPILGFGLGLGTNDTVMVKQSLRNLAVMVVVSVLASTLFFVISPLELESPTELLARTRPTIYDVLIALFGGIAGIIETTRKEKGTVISGVAIATALMPPLCTVGYGISTLNFGHIIGALYLFFINSVFIALATLIMVRYLKFPVVRLNDPDKEKKRMRAIYLMSLVIIVPSVLSGITVVRDNTFSRNARKFVEENRSINRSYIYDYKIDHEGHNRTLRISIAGEPLTSSDRQLIYNSLEQHGISKDNLIIIDQAVTARQEFSENEMLKSIFERSDREMKKRDELMVEMENELRQYRAREIPADQIAKELQAQYGDLKTFSIGRGSSVVLDSLKVEEQILVVAEWETPKTDEQIASLQRWLGTRLGYKNVKVVQSR